MLCRPCCEVLTVNGPLRVAASKVAAMRAVGPMPMPSTLPIALGMRPCGALTSAAAAVTCRRPCQAIVRRRSATAPTESLTHRNYRQYGQRSSDCKALPLEHLSTLAFVPQVCFTQECQDQADREFLLAVVPGLLLAAGLLAALFRPAPQGGAYFQDPSTQIVFEKPKDGEVGRDDKGELIYKVVSYTPYPCESDIEGERIRIDVGRVGEREPRTFVFEKLLPQPSKLVKVTLPRPLGIVFEEDSRMGRAVVAEFVEGSPAEQAMKRVQLDRSKEESTALPGDVLRAITCTTLMYGPLSQFGASAPVPNITVFSADQQKWPKIAAALKRGSMADGEVTLILERRTQRVSEEQSIDG